MESYGVFLLLSVFVVSVSRAIADCPPEYYAISPDHTMCKTDVGTPVPLSSAEKQAAVDLHNQLRSQASPTASDMQKLEYDENLALVAGKWAAQCTLAHDKQRSEPSMPGVWIGQNLACGEMTLDDSIKYWQEVEFPNFHYGQEPTGVVGHYTQLNFGKSARMGCGVASCSEGSCSKVLVCNYAAGQTTDAARTPYTKGSSCGLCPNKCDTSGGKLCDCGGKVCYNKGVLDISTCTCKCPVDYVGSQCQDFNTSLCASGDHDQCPSFKAKYGDNVCDISANARSLCPHMCNRC